MPYARHYFQRCVKPYFYSFWGALLGAVCDCCMLFALVVWFALVLAALALHNFCMYWLHQILYCLFKLSSMAICDLCASTLWPMLIYGCLLQSLCHLMLSILLIIPGVILLSFSQFMKCSFKCLSVSLYLYSPAFVLSLSIHSSAPSLDYMHSMQYCKEKMVSYAGTWIFQWIYEISPQMSQMLPALSL